MCKEIETERMKGKETLFENYYNGEYLASGDMLKNDGWAERKALRAIEDSERILNSKNNFFRKNIKGKQVLILGCGMGWESKVWKDHGYNVTGTDISRKVLKNAKQYQDKSIKMDLNKTPYPFKLESQNIIYASEVVEHLPLIEPFLTETYRILKEGGLLVITTDNPACLKNRINMAFGKFDWGAIPGHLHYYTPKKFTQLAEKADYEKMEVSDVTGRLPSSLCATYIWIGMKIYPHYRSTEWI